MFSKRWKAPASEHVFNSALHVQGLEARIDGLGSKFLSSLVTINPNLDLQHLFASYATFAPDDSLARITGSTTNRVDALTSVGIMSPDAMGFVCYVVKAASTKPGAMLGDELTEDMLADTAFQGLSGCHLRSVPLAFFLTMQLDVIHGNIKEGSTIDAFGKLGSEPDDWINSVAEAHNQKEDVNKIFKKIAGQESAFIHPSYVEKLWPETAPSISMTVGDTLLLTPEETQAIITNLGVTATSASATTTSPVVQPKEVVYVSAKDKDADKEAVSRLAFYFAMFLRGDINWDEGKITNPELPIMNQAFVDAMELKGIDARARKIKALLHDITDPDDVDELDGASRLHSALMQGNMSLTYIQDSLAKAIVTGKFSADLIDSVNVEAGEIDVYQLMGQTSGSARVKNAKSRDNLSQCDDDFEQHEHHKGKKRTSIEKLGTLANRSDAVKLAANTLVLSLLIENMAVQVKHSITYQILERFITFFTSARIVAWIDNQAESMPQFPWQMARWVEQIVVQIVKAAKSNAVCSRIMDKDIANIPLHRYNQALAIFIDMRKDVLQEVFRAHLPVNSLDEQWDIAGLEQTLAREFGVELSIQRWLDDEEQITDEDIYERIQSHFEDSYRDKAETLGDELLVRLEKEITLMILDRHWKDHLAAMDYLRQGIGLRGYAQKNPVQEYKRESFEMFTTMLDNINYEVVQALARVQIRNEEQVEALEQFVCDHEPEHEEERERHADDDPRHTARCRRIVAEVDSDLRPGRGQARRQPSPPGIQARTETVQVDATDGSQDEQEHAQGQKQQDVSGIRAELPSKPLRRCEPGHEQDESQAAARRREGAQEARQRAQPAEELVDVFVRGLDRRLSPEQVLHDVEQA